jgi:hypothetical protein
MVTLGSDAWMACTSSRSVLFVVADSKLGEQGCKAASSSEFA